VCDLAREMSDLVLKPRDLVTRSRSLSWRLCFVDPAKPMSVMIIRVESVFVFRCWRNCACNSEITFQGSCSIRLGSLIYLRSGSWNSASVME
jgi:hypothetical protein